MTQRGKRLGLLALCLSGTLLFGVLGVWQVDRLGWKRELIQRVETRIHAPAVPVPSRAQWATLDLDDAEYRRVRVRGQYLHERETLVDALTALGPGAWVLTPLQTRDGIILVNRGFIAQERRAPHAQAGGQGAGEVTVTGLLRKPEPGGRILRPNQPDADRWFSRDVLAIASARGLRDVAPFFIDADADNGADADADPDADIDTAAVSGPGESPRGGLTVVSFRNAHLAYAATWFALAALCAAGLVLLRSPRN